MQKVQKCSSLTHRGAHTFVESSSDLLFLSPHTPKEAPLCVLRSGRYTSRQRRIPSRQASNQPETNCSLRIPPALINPKHHQLHHSPSSSLILPNVKKQNQIKKQAKAGAKEKDPWIDLTTRPCILYILVGRVLDNKTCIRYLVPFR